MRREGELAHAVSFLPGFPDGSFGWAKVSPHLPNAAEMPKLFVEYVGMGDSDKPKDYAYSTAERADLVEAIWRELASGPQRWSPSTFPRLWSRSSCGAGLSALSGASLRAGRKYAESSSSMAGSSRTDISSVVHHANVAPPPQPGSPASGPILRSVQDDG